MILDVAGVSFRYGSAAVLNDITFAAGPGDVVAVMGPNGVGKTTLLKCINRIHRAAGGHIAVTGTDIGTAKPATIARLVGYVPQSGRVSGATVFESVLLGRKPRMGADLTPVDLHITGRIIDLLGLTSLAQRPVDEISGGEYQLVQIGRALAQQPQVLIMDEPTSNLDLKNQHLVMRVLNGLVRRNGMCAVMVNHDLNLALCYSNRFVMMSGGRIFAAGGREVITPANMSAVYGLPVDVIEVKGRPLVVPR